MIKISDMRKLEDEAEKRGISKLELMERAGKGIAEILGKKYSLKDNEILFVCYHGNNGGDGFTAARIIKEKHKDCEVRVFFIGEESRLKNEAKVNYDILNSTEVEVTLLEEADDYMLERLFAAPIIVDCILGIGFEGNLKEPISSIVDRINSSDGDKVSIDVPTGMDPDMGDVQDKFVNPDLVITMHDLKPGLDKIKDKVEIVDIGL